MIVLGVQGRNWDERSGDEGWRIRLFMSNGQDDATTR